MTTPLSPYLSFNTNCAEAMKSYQKILGGKLDILKIGDSPVKNEVPAGNDDRVMHARLAFDGGTIMASDTLTNQKPEPMRGVALAVQYPTAAEAKKTFEALADGGKVTMPLEPSFWAEAFGMLIDRFGTPWIINGAMKPGM